MDPIDVLQKEVGLVRERTHVLANEITDIKLNVRPHECLKEQDWGKLWEILKTCTQHISEGDGKGGFRDRVLILELAQVENVKKLGALKLARWLDRIVGGAAGGCITLAFAESLKMIAAWVMK